MKGNFNTAVLDHLADAVLVVDKHDQIIYGNAQAAELTGWSTKDLCARKFSSLISEVSWPSDQDFLVAIRSRTLNKTPLYLRLKHASGHDFGIEASLSDRFESPQVAGLIINFRSSSDRWKTVQQNNGSEVKLQTIFQNTKIAYVLLDRDYNVISYNQLAYDRYKREIGVELNEHYNFKNYLSENRDVETREGFQKVLEGEALTYETSFKQEDGSVCWYEVEMFPLKTHSNATDGLMISSEDITERKLAELDREKMTNDLLQHNKDLEQFGYIVSHNLRSPVANIRGLVSLLQTGSDMSPDDFQKCLLGLSEAAARLDGVITDLNFILQTRREIEENKEYVEFDKLMATIKTGLGDQIYRQGAIIETDFQVKSVYALRTYLHSIFINLIGNSLKYRRPEVDPIIKISTRQIGNKIQIVFCDNGLGIDLEKHGSKLFGLYKKFHLHVEGKGMGLYMVKTQVGILGGTIKVSSTLNEGTCFTIEL